MEIKPTDIISGRLYLKLISDYREYDLRQKKIIEKLRQKVELLEWSNEDLRTEIEDLEDGTTEKLRKKIKNQREALKLYSNKISRQQEEIEELKASNQILQEEINSLKGVSPNEEIFP